MKINNKAKQIMDLHTEIEFSATQTELPIACAALYVSSKGTKHFYETLSLLAYLMPNDYKDELESLEV